MWDQLITAILTTPPQGKIGTPGINPTAKPYQYDINKAFGIIAGNGGVPNQYIPPTPKQDAKKPFDLKSVFDGIKKHKPDNTNPQTNPKPNTGPTQTPFDGMAGGVMSQVSEMVEALKANASHSLILIGFAAVVCIGLIVITRPSE